MLQETILIRICLSALLGLAIGFERELHGRPAGLRTQVIVAVSSCVLMILSLELRALFAFEDASGVVRIDPSRIAAYAVAGMGFLGAGAIIHGRGSVQGLTTAACLWAANGIGLAVGAGFYFLALVATVFVLATLVLLQLVVGFLPKDQYWRVYMDFQACGDKSGEIKEMLEGFDSRVLALSFECSFENNRSSYEVALRLKSTSDVTLVIASLRRLEDLARLRWSEGFVP